MQMNTKEITTKLNKGKQSKSKNRFNLNSRRLIASNVKALNGGGGVVESQREDLKTLFSCSNLVIEMYTATRNNRNHIHYVVICSYLQISTHNFPLCLATQKEKTERCFESGMTHFITGCWMT